MTRKNSTTQKLGGTQSWLLMSAATSKRLGSSSFRSKKLPSDLESASGTTSSRSLLTWRKQTNTTRSASAYVIPRSNSRVFRSTTRSTLWPRKKIQEVWSRSRIRGIPRPQLSWSITVSRKPQQGAHRWNFCLKMAGPLWSTLLGKVKNKMKSHRLSPNFNPSKMLTELMSSHERLTQLRSKRGQKRLTVHRSKTGQASRRRSTVHRFWTGQTCLWRMKKTWETRFWRWTKRLRPSFNLWNKGSTKSKLSSAPRTTSCSRRRDGSIWERLRSSPVSWRRWEPSWTSSMRPRATRRMKKTLTIKKREVLSKTDLPNQSENKWDKHQNFLKNKLFKQT